MQMNEKVCNQETTTTVFSQKHILGFMLCILLTSFALWGAMYSSYSPKWLLYVLAAVAFSQAIVQLFQVQDRLEKQSYK